MNHLAIVLTELDPPEVDEARRWYTQAAQAGHTEAMNNLDAHHPTLRFGSA